MKPSGGGFERGIADVQEGSVCGLSVFPQRLTPAVRLSCRVLWGAAPLPHSGV